MENTNLVSCPGIDVLNTGYGDFELRFNPENPEDVGKAKHMITDMLQKGYVIFVHQGDETIRVRRFDAEKNVYIVASTPLAIAKPKVSKASGVKKKQPPSSESASATSTPSPAPTEEIEPMETAGEAENTIHLVPAPPIPGAVVAPPTPVGMVFSEADLLELEELSSKFNADFSSLNSQELERLNVLVAAAPPGFEFTKKSELKSEEVESEEVEPEEVEPEKPKHRGRPKKSKIVEKEIPITEVRATAVGRSAGG